MLTILLAELVYDMKIDWRYSLKLTCSLVGVCLFRKNGPVTFIIVAIALIIYSFRKKEYSKELIISLAAAIVVIFIINVPVYKMVGVEKDESVKGVMYVGMSQELFAAYKYGQVSDRTKEMLEVLSNNNLDNYGYNPYWAYAEYNLDVSPMEFVYSYLDTFFRNPTIVIKSILLRQDCLWNVFPGEDSIVNLVNYYGSSWGATEEWKEYYPERNKTSFGSYIEYIVRFAGDDYNLTLVVWRCGLHLLILAMAISIMIVLESDLTKRFFFILLPMFGQIISLVLSTGWADYRYYWAINLIVFFIMILFIIQNFSVKHKNPINL